MSILWLFKLSKLSELKQTLWKLHHSTVKHLEGIHRWQSFFLFFLFAWTRVLGWVRIWIQMEIQSNIHLVYQTPGSLNFTYVPLVNTIMTGSNKGQEIVKVKVAQLCPTLCDPLDIVHGILRARILMWVAFPFSGGSSQPRDRIQISYISGRFLTSWATREAREYWSG